MELKVTSLDGKKSGSVTVSDGIFGLEPRTDIIHRCVVWQLAKRQSGTHAVKNRADIARTGKKMYKQKGTGSARHGSARVNLFRGGGRSFGPHPRSHEIGLPKKVRALALKHALSAKAKDDGIIVIEALSVKEAKTKALRNHFEKLGLSNALIVDGAEIAAGVRLHSLPQPIRSGQTVFLDNGDDIAAGFLHSTAAQIRHGFALGAMDDAHPGKLARDAGGIFGGSTSHDDDFRAAILRLSLQRFQAFINEWCADDGRDYDRYRRRVTHANAASLRSLNS